MNKNQNVLISQNHGIALFIVLWVLVLLSVIVGEFCYAMRTEINITRNLKEKTESYYIALAGINTAVNEILLESRSPAKISREKEMDSEDAIKWRVNADIPLIPYKDGYFKVFIENENGKFNLNVLDRSTIITILDGFDLMDNEKEIIADSILDWRDRDNLHRLNGAEEDYYQALPKPYSCKNSDFESVEELLLVRGISPELYNSGLKYIFTVYPDGGTSKGKIIKSQEKTASMEEKKINVNAASKNALLVIPGMTEEIVEEIAAFRTTKDIASISELMQIIGSESLGKALPFLTLRQSNFYTVHSIGRVDGSRTEHYLKTMIALDPLAEQKFRFIKWWDNANKSE